MPISRNYVPLTFALTWALVSSALPVRGEMCSAVTRAAPGDDLTALRYESFVAFRAECRTKREYQPNTINNCSFVTQPHTPHRFTFILTPLTMPFRLIFEVRSKQDPHVALADNKTEESIFSQIVVGGWGNTKSIITDCYSKTAQNCTLKAVYDEAGIVSGDESRPFWVEYREGVVSVGKGGQEEAFMEWDAGAYHGQVPTQVHVGIAAWRDFPAHWVFYQFYIGGWRNVKSVIRTCHSETCETLFGGTAVHDEYDIISGEKSRPFWVGYREGVLSVGKGGQEEAFMDWDAGAHHGRVPTRAHIGIASYEFEPACWVFYQHFEETIPLSTSAKNIVQT